MTRQLVLDCGQSGIRTRFIENGTHSAGPELDGIRSHLPLLDQLATFILKTLDGRSVDVVAAGVSGLGDGDSASRLLSLLGASTATVLLAHDATTSYIGALSVGEGAVIAAGTGAVTLAVGPTRVLRVDGWGHLLGDLGSGFWIGREALSAVLAAFDGRGPATVLTDRASAEFGDLAHLYLTVQADPDRVRRIASWARTVSEATAEDDVCRSISTRAGHLLAESVSSGLHGVEATPRASYVGNVFRNQLLAEAFSDHLAALVPGVEILAPAGDGLAGATQLSLVPPDSPLGALIDSAGSPPRMVR